jgi:dihydrofolate reductase
VDEVTKLKSQTGDDIIAYGGTTFVSSLIKHDLIDEFHLFINPVAVGKGMPIFEELDNKESLVLETSRPSHVVLSCSNTAEQKANKNFQL